MYLLTASIPLIGLLTVTYHLSECTSLGQRTCKSEESYELENQAHDKEPRVAGKVRVGNQQAPQNNEHKRVEHVANVTQPKHPQAPSLSQSQENIYSALLKQTYLYCKY